MSALYRRLWKAFMPLGMVLSAPMLIWGGGDVSFPTSDEAKPQISLWNHTDVTERLRVACIGDSITFGGEDHCFAA